LLNGSWPYHLTLGLAGVFWAAGDGDEQAEAGVSKFAVTGTLQYYQRVQDTLGAQNTATFARLFLAPGGTDPAAGQPTQRPLCAYPYLSQYVQLTSLN
jgi:hypothetical protein